MNNSKLLLNMVYKKPEIVAENKAEGTFAAACPEERSSAPCTNCEEIV